VVKRLGQHRQLARARVHPLALLVAKTVYDQGHGVRGKLAWRSVGKVSKALERAFYTSFGLVPSTGKRLLLALDVSASMGFSTIAGLTGITPRVGSAAMAMATLRSELGAMTMGFSHELRPLALSPSDSLKQVLAEVDRMPMGGTDCALPMIWARKQKVPVDAFVVYTDNETWFGGEHPSVALARYRDAMGIDAKLVVVGMVSNRFTIADPRDPGMLDVVGFDTAAPKVMSQFVGRADP
jgi:60 kDa SS-A/Ro ribonucleoprotein